MGGSLVFFFKLYSICLCSYKFYSKLLILPLKNQFGGNGINDVLRIFSGRIGPQHFLGAFFFNLFGDAFVKRNCVKVP